MIFFLFGEDTYRSRQKLNAIEEKFKAADKSRINLVVLDGKKCQIKDLKKEITTVPFLNDKKLIVVENLLKEGGSAKHNLILELIEKDQIPKNHIIIFWEDSNVDQNSKLFKLLFRPRFAERFDLLVGSKLTNWIESEVKKRGSKIETKALKMLAEYVGSDLWRMNMEIEKLIAYSAARGNNIITENDVNLLVNEKGEENIFALIDALGAKNKKLILKLLEDQIKSGVNELYILKMLVRQFRILLQIKEMIEKDLFFLKKDSALKWRISKDLGIHPFAVSKALDQIKNFSFEELKTIYNSLLEIEVKIKSSNVSPLLLFEIFVAKIC